MPEAPSAHRPLRGSRLFRTERGYVEFESVISRVEAWAEIAAFDVLGYRRNSLASRLVQRVVEVGLVPFIQECARGAEHGSPLVLASEVVRFSDFTVETPSGTVRLRPLCVVRSMVEFALHWLHVAGIALLAVLSRGEGKSAATLLFGVGSESLAFGSDDGRFADFCRNGPVVPLSEATRMVVQTASKIRPVQPNRFEYARFPLFALLQGNVRSLIDFLRFMLEHLQAAGAYVFAVIRLPLVSLLGRDFAYHALVTYLNRKSLIEAVVITNSNYSSQPLWMSDLPGRRFLTHLVWYSQNTVPLVYADEPIKVNIPNFRHMRIDVSWVWTDAYAAYLRTMSIPGDIHVVGPILWYLPPVSAVPKDASDDIMFTVFDVTPVKDAVAESIGLLGNYYSTETMTQFVEETLSVCRELEVRTGRRVRLSLKHKRSYNPRLHDPRYIDLISRLSASGGGLELIPFETNMYALLANSDLVIVVPYSSPAYVASSRGAHAVYFDPTKTLMPAFQPAPLVTFASGRAELLRVALDAVSDRAESRELS